MHYLHRAWAEIDLAALNHNVTAIKNCCQQNIYAVVKADAYGHGAKEVATGLENRVAGFAVSNLDEALELRECGIQKQILILGYTPAECACVLAQQKLSQCVYSLAYAQALNDQAKSPIAVHIKLDTGMGRIGFDCRSEELPGLAEVKPLLEMDNLQIEGVFAHFAVADTLSQEDFTQQQYARFLLAVEKLEKEGFRFPIKHCGNSAALLSLPLQETNMVRAGIVLYGLAPSEDMPLSGEFKSVMSLRSVVSMVKTMEKGQSVSYGRVYETPQVRRIATVSAGYADGVPRLLSDKGYVLIRGKRAPIVGRVCMDQLCVDVTDIDHVQMGDEVTIFGPGLPVEEVAKWAQTISYEIVCGITKRVPRVYKQKD